MTLDEFQSQISEKHLTFSDPILESLYLIKQGKWDQAHDIAQEIHTKWGSLVHGLLHRIEGDEWNANYWYRKAGKSHFEGNIDEQWNVIAKEYFHTFDP